MVFRNAASKAMLPSTRCGTEILWRPRAGHLVPPSSPTSFGDISFGPVLQRADYSWMNVRSNATCPTVAGRASLLEPLDKILPASDRRELVQPLSVSISSVRYLPTSAVSDPLDDSGLGLAALHPMLRYRAGSILALDDLLDAPIGSSHPPWPCRRPSAGPPCRPQPSNRLVPWVRRRERSA